MKLPNATAQQAQQIPSEGPDEDAGIVISSHLLIRDAKTGQVLVNQRAS
jgi:putative hemolysin